MKEPGVQTEEAVAELPRCEQCGAAVCRPGVCDICAAKVSRVDHVVEVSPRAWIEPEDLREEPVRGPDK